MNLRRPLNVLLVAEESAGVQLLRRLRASEHRVVGVLTSEPDDKEAVRGATVWHVANSMDLPILPPRNVRKRSFAAQVERLEVDLLLNVHSLYIVRGEILAAPRIGSFNLHPGPLPRYAGLNSPSWAILHGETTHGVTIHWMEPGIDTVAIAYQTMFEIAPDDTGLKVASRCIREGLKLLERLLDSGARAPAEIPRLEQDASQRSYFGRETPFDGALSWDRPAREIEAFVRAADYYPLPSPWGHPFSWLGGERLGVVKAGLTGEPSDAPPGTLEQRDPHGRCVACRDEWLAVRLVHRENRYGEASSLLPASGKLRDGGAAQEVKRGDESTRH
ncbi:MAG: hypothetical protein JSV80_02675 [Acidobacteriota bacterium]|nr:MAG: hypothetical protein JSV80_02675 [Acidobacteriota bacterium]